MRSLYPTFLPQGWDQPRWKPALGIPLYVLSGLLIIGGLLEGRSVTVLHGFELVGLALLAADAWGIRQRVPVLNSSDKAVAAGGWALLLLAVAAMTVALPIL